MQSPRPTGLTAIAFWHFFVAAVFAFLVLLTLILICVVWIENAGSEAMIASFFFMLGAFVFASIAAIFAVVGMGLSRGKDWARPGALVLAALQLPLFPIGTAAGGLTLFYLLRKDRCVSAPRFEAPVAA